MAQDTVAAILATPLIGRVVVVCDDAEVCAALTVLGAECVPDQPAAGLNAAIAHGDRLLGGPKRVALTADLPALRPDELAQALALVRRRSYVPDAEGTGTVLLATPLGLPLAPRFGVGSAAAHSASGAVRLDGDWPSLRRDVDSPADLATAGALRLGRHTEDTLCAIASTPR